MNSSTSSLPVKANRVIPTTKREHLTLRGRLRQPPRRPQRLIAMRMRRNTRPRLDAPDLCF